MPDYDFWAIAYRDTIDDHSLISRLEALRRREDHHSAPQAKQWRVFDEAPVEPVAPLLPFRDSIGTGIADQPLPDFRTGRTSTNDRSPGLFE
jgi:hypothetical protein